MATNEILKFGQTASNILSQVAYDADPQRPDGVSGVGRSNLQNKFQRQVSTIAAGIAQFIADYNIATTNVTDILTAAELEVLFLDALSNAPLTTQPQFNNSTKVATTQFVNRAIGSSAGDVDYAVSTVLTAASVGMIISPTAGGVTFTLPEASGVRPGSKIYFRGNSHGCTMLRQGSDVISNGTAGNITTFSIAAYDYLELTQIDGVWTVTGGNEQLSTSTQFSSSLVNNGFQRLPGGRLEQWGFASVAFSASTSVTTINLPIAWPNAFLNGQLTFRGTAPPTIATNMSVSPNAGNPLTQIDVYGHASSPLAAESVFFHLTGH